ncbi:MAG: NifB/NifX family molybdenum-iron cluster-binding protein [Campylobacterales bacterium]|nr:NifB/NifX family molybdenum-iron cluster-binding protein [Campylobacterales bacterium]
MLAIPLDTKESTTISKLYGKAPYFALLNKETGNFSVIENEVVGKGPKSAGFLKEKGADSTVYFHMGEGVYKTFAKESMSVFTVRETFMSIDEIYRDFGKFQEVDDSNCKELLIPGDPGETCKCGCNG